MDNTKYKAIIIFGPQGSGKGTQAKLLAEDKKYIHFSTGDMFRSLKTNPEMANSDIGKKVLAEIDQGHLAPDDMTIDLLFKSLETYIAEGKYNPLEQTLILDGIPRNINQANLLKKRIEVEKIIYLYASDNKELIKRIMKRAEIERRIDDANPEVVMKRLQIYERETAPLINYYPNDIILKIDALPAIEEIHKNIIAALR